MPFAWPSMLLRTYPDGDPTPVDADMAMIFYTGAASQNNQVALFFRQDTLLVPTQGDLDGMLMSELDGPNQPDIGIEGGPPRYVAFRVRWGGGGVDTLSVLNHKGDGYDVTIPDLSADSYYVLFTHLEGTTAQATLREYDPLAGGVGAVFWDSGEINTPGLFPRRKGRYGWYANLNDTDAWVESITERSTLYAEFRTKAARSNHPVVGAELFVGTSPVVEQFEYLAPGPYNVDQGAMLERDQARSTSGESWKLTNFGVNGMQGIQSNPFTLVNFKESEVQFDLFVESDLELNALIMSLDGTRAHPLIVPRMTPGQWQRVTLFFPFDQTVLTGTYKLVLLQVGAVPATWWLDRINFRTRTISWWGRSAHPVTYSPWTPFYDVINQESGGILFPYTARGRYLQVRAEAYTNDAYIDRVQIKPKYQGLGNLIFGRPISPPEPYDPITGDGGIGAGVETTDGVIIPPLANFTWTVV